MLASQLLVSGGLTVLSVRGAQADLGRGGVLQIDVQEGMPVARLGEADAQLETRAELSEVPEGGLTRIEELEGTAVVTGPTTNVGFSGGNPTLGTDPQSPASVHQRIIENRRVYGFEESGPYAGSFSKPEVDDAKLAAIVEEAYKGVGRTPEGIANQIGTGSTMDAARYELANPGTQVRDRSHAG